MSTTQSSPVVKLVQGDGETTFNTFRYTQLVFQDGGNVIVHGQGVCRLASGTQSIVLPLPANCHEGSLRCQFSCGKEGTSAPTLRVFRYFSPTCSKEGVVTLREGAHPLVTVSTSAYSSLRGKLWSIHDNYVVLDVPQGEKTGEAGCRTVARPTVVRNINSIQYDDDYLHHDMQVEISLDSSGAGVYTFEFTFEVTGISKEVDYQFELSPTTATAVLEGQLLITNNAGTPFELVQLLLQQGARAVARSHNQQRRIETLGGPQPFETSAMLCAMSESDDGSGVEKVGDVTIVTLPGVHKLDEGSLQQLPFVRAQVPYRIEHRLPLDQFWRSSGHHHRRQTPSVQSTVVFRNNCTHGPQQETIQLLPGSLVVYEQGKGNHWHATGRGLMEFIPAGSEAMVPFAFGQNVQVTFATNDGESEPLSDGDAESGSESRRSGMMLDRRIQSQFCTRTCSVHIQNGGDEGVTILVWDTFHARDRLTVLDNSCTFERNARGEDQASVTISAGKEVTLTFSVRAPVDQ